MNTNEHIHAREDANEGEGIVVFMKFRESISANIVKSKLDAYGVPCFLTEENLSNLYPGASALMDMQVRLHVLAQDVEAARQVLAELHLTLEDDSVVQCPDCHSTDIDRDFPKDLSENTLSALRYLFFGIFSPEKKVYRCANCEREF
jgi:hypothetical protein